MDKFNLHRFIEAQEYDYPIALEEIREGRKNHIGFGISSLN